jgi:hypothetical protein
MKKMLMTLTMAGALAFPVGVALAQDDSAEPADAPTVVEPIHERARLRQHQEDEYRQCDGTAEMEREQERTRAHVADGSGQEVQHRSAEQTGDCSGDCTGEQVRDRDRDHDHAGLEMRGAPRGG